MNEENSYHDTMIVKSTAGLIYPKIGYNQYPQYIGKPNQYMSDLKNITLEQQHTAAMNQHMEADLKIGREFAQKAVEKASWEDSKGSIIDHWA